MLSFACDYIHGAHPLILERLTATNMETLSGYGVDHYCAAAKQKIREACACPTAEVHFLVGGTQTNAVVIDSLLRSYEGVVAASTGHVNVHEAGAIEYTGHKVLPRPEQHGKLCADEVEAHFDGFFADDHGFGLHDIHLLYRV